MESDILTKEDLALSIVHLIDYAFSDAVLKESDLSPKGGLEIVSDRSHCVFQVPLAIGSTKMRKDDQGFGVL